MTCEDCIHHDLCKHESILLVEESCSAEQCVDFKDSSRFIEQVDAFWIEDEDCYGEKIYQCSNCGMYFALIDGTPKENEYTYCPSCGAKIE